MKLPSLPKFKKLQLVIIISLILILLGYFIPFPVNFEGEICTHKLKWDVPAPNSKVQTIIEDMSVKEMLIDSLDSRKIEISGQKTNLPIEFSEGKYSVQDLKAEGLLHFEAAIFHDDRFSMSIKAKKISFVVIDDEKKLLNYKVGVENIETKDRQVTITAHTITLTAKLFNGNKSEIFSSSFRNLKIAPNSMQFHFVKEDIKEVTVFKLTKQSYKDLKKDNLPEELIRLLENNENQLHRDRDEADFIRAIEKVIGSEQTDQYKSDILKRAKDTIKLKERNYNSAILGGNLKVQKPSKDIELSKNNFIKFFPNTQGITKLHSLILIYPKAEGACFLVNVSGKANRITYGSDHKSLQKKDEFNLLEAILGHNKTQWVMSVAVGGIVISLLTELIRKELFKNDG